MQILDCYQTSKVNSEAFGFAFKQATSTKVKVEELDELMQIFRKKKWTQQQWYSQVNTKGVAFDPSLQLDPFIIESIQWHT